jgi:hypothetical protein
MIDFMIKREINKTLKGVHEGKMNKNSALKKLDNLQQEAKRCPKGKKRPVKNDIFRTKRMLKI